MTAERHIDFLSKRKLAYFFSGTLFLISLISFFVKGLDLGIDFTGGSVYEMHYNQSVDIDKMRSTLEQQGFADANLQNFGSSQDILIRLKPIENISQKELSEKVLSVANSSQAQAGELRRVEFVGPQVGDELINDGGLALFFAFVGVMVYVSIRFEWKLSVGAIAALFHDTIITMGFFSVFGWEFDMTVLSAILALIGYSINDTIVVYDRIRETVRTSRREPIADITNRALNDTLSRTILTSLTVFLTLLALAFLGGKTIHGFAIAMLIGVIKGTYSSIYIASSLALSLGLTREDLMPPEKDETVDQLP
ncbi:protein translocase subunit SecF [Methylomonas sp. MED-D]|uniref:Protein-export membrane protein SecF n=1 Tax=Methylomonas koyamae TaxID=702114 RepID=A0A177N1R9_9GAMM|nr:MULTISPECIES: protein translocase subunit SecF [Methylomonas]NJA05700.1 protein translocase subunit SecF [Methylococcaceae bacterium WWC4]MDT4330117.1 protein translocase subunit SecF [Methylomonas sp. MV1]OAI11832.1 preprotein translocase subunit SecF [Methylomonas koyamae]OHX37541.1 protein-export membrane protein SecF [Methylomonas sp. LWB]WGS86752.1 protein translocase subunit SecF [Methylomonas sp. UP202]